MDREFIGDSDCISSVGYDIELKDLEIELTDGSVYTYHGVSHLVYANLLRVTSKGWFYNKYIRTVYNFS
jgi:hypothetical protein